MTLLEKAKAILFESSEDLLNRKFSDKESNYPFIIPALKNGMEVKVTQKIAKLFDLADLELIKTSGTDKGKKHHIEFSKPKNGIITMKLVKS